MNMRSKVSFNQNWLTIIVGWHRIRLTFRSDTAEGLGSEISLEQMSRA